MRFRWLKRSSSAGTGKVFDLSYLVSSSVDTRYLNEVLTFSFLRILLNLVSVHLLSFKVLELFEQCEDDFDATDPLEAENPNTDCKISDGLFAGQDYESLHEE